MRAPAQHLVEERAFALALEDEIDQGRCQGNRHQREIAQIIDQQFELKDQDIAEKRPAITGVCLPRRKR